MPERLAIEDHHRRLHEDLKPLLGDAIGRGFEGRSHDSFESVDEDHGRVDPREVNAP